MVAWSADNQPPSPIGHPHQCIGVARSGEQCRRWALKGCTRCPMHRGYAERKRHNPAILAARKIKAEVTRSIRQLGADELWQVEAFRRGHSRHKLALFEAWQRAQAEADPGVLVRAIEVAEEEQRWRRLASDRS